MATTETMLERKRKRPRAARACELCRAKKYRCDEMDPCSRCRRWKVECIYQDADQIRERLSHAIRNDLTAELDLPGNGSKPYSHHDADGRQPQHCIPSGSKPGGISPEDVSDAEGEVSEINPHTLNTEFHGPTSSLAFLASIQRQQQSAGSKQTCPSDDSPEVRPKPLSLVSAFHNNAFSPEAIDRKDSFANIDGSLSSERFYFRQSHHFVEGYFQNLHFIHPFVDRKEFLLRCEDLWFGRSHKQPRSFIALYYAIMSLGAIIREWDEDSLDGLGRFEWSRKMFRTASLALSASHPNNDVETVQANIVMAKVCQNELNPHLAYMYLGSAIRTSLSAGHNRQSTKRRTTLRNSASEATVSRTWWGLYSLEVEMSFALGRPDTLGMDAYHNCELPLVNGSETDILPLMVDLARIIKQVSPSVYLPLVPLQDKLREAQRIEIELDEWLTKLPLYIQPRVGSQDSNINMLRIPKWAKRQRHTLEFRYYNVKMVLYRPFLLFMARNPLQSNRALAQVVDTCVSAARNTIQTMHQMYCSLTYFRTWWYNTTYTLYAASILLSYGTWIAGHDEWADLEQLLRMSVEVLSAMDENVVAKQAAELLAQASTQLKEKMRPPMALPLPAPPSGLPAVFPSNTTTPLMQLADVTIEASQNQNHSQNRPPDRDRLQDQAQNQGLPVSDIFFDLFADDDLRFMDQLFPLGDNHLQLWNG